MEEEERMIPFQRRFQRTTSEKQLTALASMRRFLLLALLLPALGSAQSTKLSVPVTVDTLPNGLISIIHEDHSVPRVATNIWYRVGSGDLRAVLQQTVALYGARTALLHAQSERRIQRVNLYLALGGGFDLQDAATSDAGTPSFVGVASAGSRGTGH